LPTQQRTRQRLVARLARGLGPSSQSITRALTVRLFATGSGARHLRVEGLEVTLRHRASHGVFVGHGLRGGLPRLRVPGAMRASGRFDLLAHVVEAIEGLALLEAGSEHAPQLTGVRRRSLKIRAGLRIGCGFGQTLYSSQRLDVTNLNRIRARRVRGQSRRWQEAGQRAGDHGDGPAPELATAENRRAHIPRSSGLECLTRSREGGRVHGRTRLAQCVARDQGLLGADADVDEGHEILSTGHASPREQPARERPEDEQPQNRPARPPRLEPGEEQRDARDRERGQGTHPECGANEQGATNDAEQRFELGHELSTQGEGQSSPA